MTARSRPRGQRAALFVVVTVFIDAMGIGIIMPVMPDLIRELTDLPLGAAALRAREQHVANQPFMGADDLEVCQECVSGIVKEPLAAWWWWRGSDGGSRHAAGGGRLSPRDDPRTTDR